MAALDDKDRAILDGLSQDARTPLKRLAAAVGLARSSVRARIAKLEALGVLRGYRAQIVLPDEPEASAAYLIVRLAHTPARALIKKLQRKTEVRRCSSISGDIDLIISVRAASVARLNTLRDWLAGEPEVAEVRTAMVLNEEIVRP